MDRDENAVNILMRFLARLGPHTEQISVRCAEVFTAIEHRCAEVFTATDNGTNGIRPHLERQ
jgi:hypothetical protein